MNFFSLAKNYMDALLNLRRNEASDMIMKAVEEGTSIKDIYMNVFEASQHEIGRLWQTNQITVAQEHFCTAATQRVMSQLYPHIFSTQKKWPPDGGSVCCRGDARNGVKNGSGPI
nr:B12-binding domain-containing protein [Methanobacterium formicicum]